MAYAGLIIFIEKGCITESDIHKVKGDQESYGVYGGVLYDKQCGDLLLWKQMIKMGT